MGDLKKGLTKNDICDILKRCSECNVSKIKLGDLEIEFNKINENIELPTEVKDNLAVMEEIDKKAFKDEMADFKQLDYEELMLTDPDKYEALQQAGELDAESDDI